MACAKTTSRQQTVTADWTVSDIVERYPQVKGVLAEYGLHCFGCSASASESLGDGCRVHGFEQEDINQLVADLNQVIADTPSRPQELSITEEAAMRVRELAKESGADGVTAVDGKYGLSVRAGRDGSFFLEFQEGPGVGERVFRNGSVADVEIYASVLTLQRIGGSAIVFKDGRFALEVGKGLWPGRR